MSCPPFWFYYVKVENAHQSVEKVKANGGHVLNGPMEVVHVTNGLDAHQTALDWH